MEQGGTLEAKNILDMNTSSDFTVNKVAFLNLRIIALNSVSSSINACRLVNEFYSLMTAYLLTSR